MYGRDYTSFRTDDQYDNYGNAINSTTSESNKFNLNIAIINCQSIVAKKASFHNFLTEHNPDIIAGCESWLTPSIKSAEIFPNNLKIYRRDRSDGYGGVFVACQETLITDEVVHKVNVEAVICTHKTPTTKVFNCLLHLQTTK